MNYQVDSWKYEYVELPKIKSEEDIDLYVEAAEKYFPKWTKGKYHRVWNNDKIYDKGKELKMENPLALEKWQFEQIRRCIEGHDGLPGKMYFYYHFCTIRNISGGFIRPDFRVSDIVWFHLLDSCEQGAYNEGNGIICVKRRRGGFSWKQAADSLHDALFKEGFRVGMTSKDEDAAKDLMKKVYQMYDRLPTFLKHPWSNKTQESIILARKEEDDLGQRSFSGNESEIYCHAPTDSCFEGEQIGKMVIDEAGKIRNLETIWSMGLPTLMEETKRVGIPVLFGTAGEQEKVGVGQKVFWKNSQDFDMIRFFFPGWAGLMCDDSGNDNIKESVKWILKEREKRMRLDDDKKLIEFIQQYPLYASEAFLTTGHVGIGNLRRISEQASVLEESEPRKVKGKFRWGNSNEGEVVFEPNTKFDNSGQCIIYEHPSKGMDYVSGQDPADHDYVQQGASNLSMYIMSKQRGSRPPQIVFSYTDRPQKVDDFYEQSIMALIYYNNTKTLIENNRNGMIKFYERNGYTYLLRQEPIAKNKLSRTATNKIGVTATAKSIQEMERLINHYTDDHCNLIPDIDLLDEFTKYGEENVDRVMAFGWTLVALEDEYITVKQREEIKTALPTTRLRRVGGVMRRIKRG